MEGPEESLKRKAVGTKKTQVWGPTKSGSGEGLQMHMSEKRQQGM